MGCGARSGAEKRSIAPSQYADALNTWEGATAMPRATLAWGKSSSPCAIDRSRFSRQGPFGATRPLAPHPDAEQRKELLGVDRLRDIVRSTRFDALLTITFHRFRCHRD